MIVTWWWRRRCMREREHDMTEEAFDWFSLPSPPPPPYWLACVCVCVCKDDRMTCSHRWWSVCPLGVSSHERTLSEKRLRANSGISVFKRRKKKNKGKWRILSRKHGIPYPLYLYSTSLFALFQNFFAPSHLTHIPSHPWHVHSLFSLFTFTIWEREAPLHGTPLYCQKNFIDSLHNGPHMIIQWSQANRAGGAGGREERKKEKIMGNIYLWERHESLCDRWWWKIARFTLLSGKKRPYSMWPCVCETHEPQVWGTWPKFTLSRK